MVFIHACKSYHQKVINYRGCFSRNHPAYLILKKDNHIFLNLVDAPKERYYDNDTMHEAVACAVSAINNGMKVFIHCDQGQSRSPMIGFLILKSLKIFDHKSFEDSYKEYLYGNICPNSGILEYCKLHWDEY